MTHGCSDRDVEKLLHVYELNLLSESDRERVELHIMDCPSCFARVEKMAAAASLINSDPDIRAAMAARAKDGADDKSVDLTARKRGSGRSWARFITPGLAAVLAILFFVLKPWDIQIRPTQEAIAVENRLAVMYFANLADETDSTRLGNIVASLLRTDLSGSHYVQVVSSQHMYDLQLLVGGTTDVAPDRNLASEIASRAAARWMVMGSIVQETPALILTVEIVDTKSGDITWSDRLTAVDQESVFDLVDRLTVAVKDHLVLPADAYREPDQQVAGVTTSSTEAYRHYVDGLELYYRYYVADAIEQFEKAVACDSTFAMAYYSLASLKSRDYMEPALRYADKATEKEQHYIRSLKATYDGDLETALAEIQAILARYPDEKSALYSLGRSAYARESWDTARVYLKRVIAVDSLFRPAYNQLAYTYDHLGCLDSAMIILDHYESIAPTEANPPDSRGDIYARNGMLDEAIAAYAKALSIDPDFFASQWKLGHMYLYRGDYDKAEQTYRQSIASKRTSVRAAARLYLCYPYAVQGRMQEALRILDDAIGADRTEQAYANLANKHHLKATFLAAMGQTDKALIEIQQAVDYYTQAHPNAPAGWPGIYQAQLQVQSGDNNNAIRLKEAFAEMGTDGQRPACYFYLEGVLEEALQDFVAAARSYEQGAALLAEFPVHYCAALAALEAGQYAEAAELLEGQLRNYSSWRAFWCIWSVNMHYYLGRAYQELDRIDDALAQYERFLEIRANADSDLGLDEDARARIAVLTNTP
ncbi:MAG: tetratricopeptide repeat protein [candidate division Zixibacteria bacterium]|nr:tetratricopeptide repeat protein [candidate division Zixibacteria bacterium]